MLTPQTPKAPPRAGPSRRVGGAATSRGETRPTEDSASRRFAMQGSLSKARACPLYHSGLTAGGSSQAGR
eukprot:774064-Alexandrium_andersonii.AAC.1